MPSARGVYDEQHIKQNFSKLNGYYKFFYRSKRKSLERKILKLSQSVKRTVTHVMFQADCGLPKAETSSNILMLLFIKT